MNNAARIQYKYTKEVATNNHNIANNTPQNERRRKKNSTHNHTIAERWHFNHSNNKLHQTHTYTHTGMYCVFNESYNVVACILCIPFKLIQVKRI